MMGPLIFLLLLTSLSIILDNNRFWNMDECSISLDVLDDQKSPRECSILLDVLDDQKSPRDPIFERVPLPTLPLPEPTVMPRMTDGPALPEPTVMPVLTVPTIPTLARPSVTAPMYLEPPIAGPNVPDVTLSNFEALHAILSGLELYHRLLGGGLETSHLARTRMDLPRRSFEPEPVWFQQLSKANVTWVERLHYHWFEKNNISHPSVHPNAPPPLIAPDSRSAPQLNPSTANDISDPMTLEQLYRTVLSSNNLQSFDDELRNASTCLKGHTIRRAWSVFTPHLSSCCSVVSARVVLY